MAPGATILPTNPGQAPSGGLIAARHAQCNFGPTLLHYLATGDNGGNPSYDQHYADDVGASMPQARAIADKAIQDCDAYLDQQATSAAAATSQRAAATSEAQAATSEAQAAATQEQARGAFVSVHRGQVRSGVPLVPIHGAWCRDQPDWQRLRQLRGRWVRGRNADQSGAARASEEELSRLLARLTHPSTCEDTGKCKGERLTVCESVRAENLYENPVRADSKRVGKRAIRPRLAIRMRWVVQPRLARCAVIRPVTVGARYASTRLPSHGCAVRAERVPRGAALGRQLGSRAVRVDVQSHRIIRTSTPTSTPDHSRSAV
jgi:hypothetical protein